MFDRLLFILNQHSGRRQLSRLTHTLRHAFPGFICEFLLLARREEWSEVRERMLTGKYRAAIISGGDGTINASLTSLSDMGFPIGFLPSGTANDFASGLGYGTNPLADLAQAVRTHRMHRIDVLSANGIPFLTVGGFGLGAAVTKTINERRDASAFFRLLINGLGATSYALVSVYHILIDSTRSQPLRVTMNGHTTVCESQVLLVCNQARLAHNLKISPTSLNDDGLFEVVLLKNALRYGRTQILNALARSIFVGGIPGAELTSTKALTVESVDESPLTFFADGETLLRSPRVEFCISPKKLLTFDVSAGTA